MKKLFDVWMIPNYMNPEMRGICSAGITYILISLMCARLFTDIVTPVYVIAVLVGGYIWKSPRHWLRQIGYWQNFLWWVAKLLFWTDIAQAIGDRAAYALDALSIVIFLLSVFHEGTPPTKKKRKPKKVADKRWYWIPGLNPA